MNTNDPPRYTRRQLVFALGVTLLVALSVVGYVVLLVLGELPENRRINATELTMLIFVVIVLMLTVRPQILDRIKLLQVLGFKLEMIEKVEKRQTELDRTQTNLDERMKLQQQELDRQQKIINDLVIYSLSYTLFELLSNFYHGRRVIYTRSAGFDRNLRFLRDHGYIGLFRFDRLSEGQDLARVLELTPAGRMMVEQREQYENAH